MAQLLLDYKADVNARDNEGTTPLQAAVGGDRKAMVKLLLAHGAKINDGSDNGCTALHSAAADGLADMIELLVSHGADINARNSNGESPLDLATFGDTTFPADPFFFHPRRDIVELLRSHKAQYTVFDAAALGDVQYVQNAVMQNPYLVSTKGSRGKMLLHYAAQQEQSEMAEFLIANKAEVDATDRDGRTPLHCAADACRLEVVKLLLANKADVNARDSGGETPLYLAASMPRKDVDVVELLLEHGADVNAKTNDGRTPLYESIRDGPVAEILRQHGGHI
jgi:ankyrin repeat protein